MAHLTDEELDFLIELENQLGAEESWSDRVRKLWEINDRHIRARQRIEESKITKQKVIEFEKIKDDK